MKQMLIVGVISLFTLADVSAQTTLREYRAEVLDYSHEIELSELAIEEANADMLRANKGYLPRLDLSREATLGFRHTPGVRPWSWSTDATISQPIFDGGSVRAAAKRSRLAYEKSVVDDGLVRLDVLYAADAAYWRLSRAAAYRDIIREYVAAVDSLRIVVERRFTEGYSAKGDLLQIESRMSDARYQLSSAEQSYTIALHNYNSLRGADLGGRVELLESIFDERDMPRRVSIEDVVDNHPRYRSAQLSMEYARWGIRSAVAPFMPSINVAVYGTLHPQLPHVKGGGLYGDGGVVLSFATPIFHFGERRQATRSAKAKYMQQIVAKEQTEDDIALIEGDAWTNMYNSHLRVEAARASLDLARENLEMSIYSYGEGLGTILDVLQAQISWLQIYQNVVAAYYDYAMAIASYEYVTAKDER
ncbi:MAG: TolC family protein [Alistipes sp.]|nr:TolC family protein [Alistipes sp.]